ncbi:putative blue pigment (indigoidine) exporter [Rhizobium sp. BK529]|uniref:DMT family transporter n=1 Tax=unclassified Rhizobium TaxID=2613769 RepID=UPI0010497001|nr:MULTISPECIES: DMT family transporter [unclassified Rhizobium]MBB3590851.1 putative blue pigment (indigoidine) exporter [Rhizobium sp. BK529]TCS09194.1 threonine/homoserine efflux transporter RhtA [Rhizobium sp. BK418]
MASIANSPKSPAAVLAALFCFSAGPVGFAIQKYLTAWFSPASIIAVQMTIGAAALWAVMLLLPWQRVSLSDRLKPFAVGIIHPGIFMITFTMASRSLDGVTLILLSAFMPAVVGLAARVFLGEPLKATTFIGMGVGFAGLLLVISERQMTGESSLAGYVTALLALCLAACGQLLGRALHTRSSVPWTVVATMQLTAAAVVAWVVAIVSGLGIGADDIGEHWMAFCYIGLVATAGGYFAYNFALSKMPVLQLGLISSIGPAAGAAAAAVIFDSPFGVRTAGGVAMIIAGTALPGLLALLRARSAAG